MFSELLEEYQGQPVVDFNDAKTWKGASVTYRLREEYDDELKVSDRLSALLAQPDCKQISTLIIGAWSGACEGGDSADIVKDLVAAAPKLSGLRHLFFGEMTVEECEVSWINQTDLTPLLNAYPALQSLRVRGGTGLSFSPSQHNSLQELSIEAGGLSRSTLREIFLCHFPALEHLELLLGESNYGFDGGIEDLQPLLSGRLFPKLKYLGLMNSEIANDIAAVLVNSPIVDRLEVLDLSLGNMDNEGMQSLQRLATYKNLRLLNVSHHYASEDSATALKSALPFEVLADDPQEPEDDWRPIVHAE